MIHWVVLAAVPLALSWLRLAREHAQAPARIRFAHLARAAASIAVGVVPLIVLDRVYGVPRKLTVGYGFVSFGISLVAVKMPLYRFVVVRILHPRLRHPWLAAAQGLVSAGSELGVAALFFLYVLPPLTVAQVIGFGLAAGSLEAIVLPAIGSPLRGTPVGEHAEAVAASTTMSMLWLSVLERALASVVHASGRGLVYVGIVSGAATPIVAAVAAFALVDGAGYYGYLRRQRFDEPRVLLAIYAALAAIALVLTASFAAYARWIPR